ncbi:FAD-dependent oxidoreductase [Rhodococcus sp. MEB064]|uniref:FAD-dependent oxidoreductase n=1 Tax=Rhodococcus sp. MEB064 TaxID=1587522 RepID=UPI0005AC636F|nr:FAD-dependent oxidoreductase [Rhodococcus sp. MEB064]KIQ17546.1 monooxygenase [Rhodococcus sp. MEB064]
MSEDQQVTVIGAGPTGLLTALGLARQGVTVTVVERAPGLQDTPRAIVYHWSTLDGLARLDLLDDAGRAGFFKQDYAYRVRATGEIISYGLAALDGKVERPHNLHLGQGALAAVVLGRLEAFDNVRVLWGHEVTAIEQDATGVNVTVRGADSEEVLRSEWLVGADGAGSAVRRLSGLEFEGMTWPERFVATNIRFPDDREGWAQSTFYLDDVYGAIIAKIDESGDHGLWRYTYMEDADLPADSIDDRMPRFLSAVFGHEVADRIEVVATSPYRMHQRAASAFRVGRVLLAGDAAHATNPTGGLGLTMGLFDAYSLIEGLGAVVTGRASDDVLDEYARQRRSAFVDKASPRASSNKKLLFHSSDPVQRDRDLDMFRRMSRDREFAADVLYFTKTLESPSLLSV